jgi:hypothetical protein
MASFLKYVNKPSDIIVYLQHLSGDNKMHATPCNILHSFL